MNLFFNSRRGLLKAALALTVAAPALAMAQAKPIEWVHGYAAGGGSDSVVRTVAAQMSPVLGRTIVVNNKPGAATNLAAGYVAQSKDIGNVMLTADFATLAANPFLFSKLPYDAEKDFKSVGMIARFPMFLVVGPSVPAKNFKEFQEWVKSNPTNANYASAGIGSPHHLATEMLRERASLKLTHIAYRGAAPAVSDLLGGQVPWGLMDSGSVHQYLISGKLRAIGVASAKRLPAFPDVPTLAEQGLEGYEAYAWLGLVAPAATPAPVVADLAKALQAALASGPVKERFQALSLEALPGTADQMAVYIRSERERWGKLIRANNIKLD